MNIKNDILITQVLKLIELGHVTGQSLYTKDPSIAQAKEYTNTVLQMMQNSTIGTDPNPDVKDDCYICEYKQSVPGNTHIACNNPDPNMTGNSHGIKNGWFLYPLLFDPNWKTKKCFNFKKK